MTDVLLFDSLPPALRRDIAQGVERSLCPRCDGGRSKERSLSIRQDDNAVLSMKCFRASCGWFSLTMTDPDARLQTKQIKPPRVYRDAIHPLGRLMKQRLAGDYGCDLRLANEHGFGQNEGGDQLIMPVRAPYGGLRGHVTRTFSDPKRCYTFKATAQPWLDWWPQPSSGSTVIVEDCISALRLAGLGYTAVALLGTNISIDQAREIADHSGDAPILALDRDAFEKAIKLARRHAHILTMRPICLDEDIKNVQDDSDIHALLTG